MKISERAEPLARAAIHAAVRRDVDALRKALRMFPDEETARQAVELTLAVTRCVMVEIHEGEPSDEETRAVAAEIASAEAWARPTAERLTAFLLGLMRGRSVAGPMPAEDVVVLAFVSAANLLSSCRRDDEEWWEHLDRAEAALEAA